MTEKEISMVDLRPNLTQVLNEVTTTSVTYTVTRFGKPVVTIGPFEQAPLNSSDTVNLGDDSSQVDPEGDPFS